MSWACRLVDIIDTQVVEYNPSVNGIKSKTFLKDSRGEIIDWRTLPIGSMFYLPEGVNEGAWPWYLAGSEYLSEHYYADNKHRQPLFVILPGPNLFLIDGKCWSNGKKYGGWKVSGEAPRITVEPSINLQGSYHGWLRDGVISDDCEGRTF